MPRLARARRAVALLGFAVTAIVPVASAAPAGAVPAQDAGDLVGTFAIAPGACSPGASGSYFRMILPTGGQSGPFIDNGDSTCADRTYTLLAPGTDGGLVTGAHQPAPSPGFDAGGNSLAVRIIRPVRFFGVDFSGSTNARDLQTGHGTDAPSLRAEGGRLVGDVSAFAATWNKQAFNQGSPKPDGSTPGNTAPVAGTFDAGTGAFSLTWSSQIVGGPFDNFTGVWHLEGTFTPAGSPAAPATAAPGGSTAGTTPTAAVPGAPVTVAPGAEAAPVVTPGATGDQAGTGDGQALTATVRDEGFEAAWWVVVPIALAGIAGVVVLYLLGRGPAAETAGRRLPAPAIAAGPPTRRWPLRATLAIGLGVALAPAVFQMFGRAPAGGDMIDDFEPHMTSEEIGDFQADLGTIGAARDEAADVVAASATGAAGHPAVAAFTEQWPAIDEDMGSMLETMDDNIDNYLGVAALPPFALFPWFFVIPGVLIAGVAAWSLRVDRGEPARGRKVALVALAVGLIAAPAVFQMFTRAPGGADMISDFKPFMRPAKVTEIQGYFLTIGNAEGELRRTVVPELDAAGLGGTTPAISTLNEQWPEISGSMAPMIGTMADNVDAFAGIAALPPFWAFPWFFVIPGVLILGLVAIGGRPLVLPARTTTLEGTLASS